MTTEEAIHKLRENERKSRAELARVRREIDARTELAIAECKASLEQQGIDERQVELEVTSFRAKTEKVRDELMADLTRFASDPNAVSSALH